jgi:hypothetical protein
MVRSINASQKNYFKRKDTFPGLYSVYTATMRYQTNGLSISFERAIIGLKSHNRGLLYLFSYSSVCTRTITLI